MAKKYYLTTNPLDLITDPTKAVLALPLNIGAEAHRFDDNGNVTGDQLDIDFYNIHTVIIPPGNSGNDSLRGTAGNDVIFWDFQSLSLISVSLSLLTRHGLPSAGAANVIERFDLGNGNDIINLTYNAGGLVPPSPGPYTADALIYGGSGNDVVWSGAGNDVLFGDAGRDWLDGGAGNDTIYGGGGRDSLVGGSGDDTIYGDGGAESLIGGSGDDTLFASDGVAMISGGDGADLIQLASADSGYVLSSFVSGDDNANDGADLVLTSGVYSSLTVALGGGSDDFIGSSSLGGANRDIVSGESGDDLIATHEGDDLIFGGDGDDVLWGGAGSDVIYGGAGDDVIYMELGGNNVSYGGSGEDIWYMFRNDGTGNQIYDSVREGQPASNTELASALILSGDPAPDEGEGSDFLANGSGVYEADHDIMDNEGGDDMVWVRHVDTDANNDGTIAPGEGNIFQLDVVGRSGAIGTLGMTVQFDPRDVPNIVLWDNDAVLGQVQQLYVWDGSQYVFWTG